MGAMSSPPAAAAPWRTWVICAVITLVVIAGVWLLPPVGLVAAAVLLALLPPWGRSIAERAAVSGVVVLGIIAIVFPRAGATPVTHVSARLLVTLLLLAVLALRLVPRLRGIALPRVGLVDAIAGLVAVVTGWWAISSTAGRSIPQIVASLFFSGWDNQGHFTTFANTAVVGSTTWPTGDGSVAWNQWYPSLHTTAWALGQLAGTTTEPTRMGLVAPYAWWSAMSFAFCLAALTWVAGDLAGRMAAPDRRRIARPLGAAAFAVFAILGSPAFLFNGGFTNFVMGVTVVVLVSYLSARSLRSAQLLGWFLVPLGALAVIGLWTPLVLGIVPAGVVVAVALWRLRWWVSVAWLVATAVIAVVVAVTQSAAILGVEPGAKQADFSTSLGAVSTGMVPFNLALALASPVIVLLAAALLIGSKRGRLAVAVAGPVLGCILIAAYFARSADAAGISRLHAYYVLKPLDGALIAACVLIAGLAGLTVSRAMTALPKRAGWIGAALAGVVAVSLFGYFGTSPDGLGQGFSAAPAVQAGADRMRGVDDPLIGVSIVNAAVAAEPYPRDVTMLFDGSGTLPNLWVSSLHGVMSKAQNAFYRDLPTFPYDSRTIGYLQLGLRFHPTWTFAALWFRPTTGQMLQEAADPRIVPVRFSVGQNALCPECTP